MLRARVLYRVPIKTARLRQDVVFRVGARLGKFKRKELEKASPAVGGNVLRLIRTFKQCIEENRPDSKEEVVVQPYRKQKLRYHELCAPTGIFRYLLCTLQREVLFACGAIDEPVSGGYISLRLIGLFVPDKDEYAVLSSILREARPTNNLVFCRPGLSRLARPSLGSRAQAPCHGARGVSSALAGHPRRKKSPSPFAPRRAAVSPSIGRGDCGEWRAVDSVLPPGPI
jgi:hypothetical protein